LTSDTQRPTKNLRFLQNESLLFSAAFSRLSNGPHAAANGANGVGLSLVSHVVVARSTKASKAPAGRPFSLLLLFVLLLRFFFFFFFFSALCLCSLL
jgi:hypothetical protein